jgi:hypothetical protein
VADLSRDGFDPESRRCKYGRAVSAKACIASGAHRRQIENGARPYGWPRRRRYCGRGMNDRVHGHTSRLDRVVLAVIAANAVALVAGVVIDGHARLFQAVHDGSSGACTA